MRSLLLFLVLSLLLVSKSGADNFIYTGNNAEKIDPIGYVSGGQGALGGPAANERLGLAQQFIINQNTHMVFLDVNALVSPTMGTTTFTYNLYTSSTYNYLGDTHLNPIPLTSSLVLQSQPLSFTTTQQDDNLGLYRNFTEHVPFDYTLSPGNYWLAEEGTGGTYVTLHQSYDDGGNTAQTPEPPIWVLFVGFFLLVLFKGKKYVALE